MLFHLPGMVTYIYVNNSLLNYRMIEVKTYTLLSDTFVIDAFIDAPTDGVTIDYWV